MKLLIIPLKIPTESVGFTSGVVKIIFIFDILLECFASIVVGLQVGSDDQSWTC